MAWSPQQELVTLHQAKQRVSLPLDIYEQDAHLLLQLQIAHAICFSYVTQRKSGAEAWIEEVSGWDATTAPIEVLGAILEQFAFQWRFRGDDEEALKRSGKIVICPNAEALLYRLRDPTVA